MDPKLKKILTALLPLLILMAFYSLYGDNLMSDNASHTLDSIPEYSGRAFVAINDNVPSFKESELTTEAYEYFAELDSLGRCGLTMACIGQELMPTGDRESISHVYPSGWVNMPYSFVDGTYLYNRCHLIGFQLTGENDNKQNLITGTRYMNTEGMLPFENMVADYVKETGNHVLYRVTPIFAGDELVARGVQIEAYSVEDNGDGICFNVYCYNVQPGVIIDYATGESSLDEEYLNSGEQGEFVLNTNSKKFHLPSCSGATDMSEKNRQDFEGSRELLIAQGFEPCSQCNP
ncbi:MAG: DNA/RNA non-specific endonuclease [Oscillospiraceae bacterium]|nr:DNA/RNA non-specific endonuclease [Oscillospiraceae bacterium]